MLEFLRPIVIFSPWLYVLLGSIALFFLRAMLLARKDRGRSIFTLERENANARMTRNFFGLMIVLGLVLGVYYLSLAIPPILPPPPATPTPPPLLELRPTSTQPPLLFTPTPTAAPVPTPTPFIPPVTTVPTPPPVARPVVQPANCPFPGSLITQPGNGARVSGIIQISGAAFTENFDYYKFEFRVPGSEQWSFIERYNNAVPNGALGSWNSDTVLPGEYEFRLVVVDTIGNYPEPCLVRLIVE